MPRCDGGLLNHEEGLPGRGGKVLNHDRDPIKQEIRLPNYGGGMTKHAGGLLNFKGGHLSYATMEERDA